MNQLDRIRQKLSRKGIRINPPVPLETVTAFESKYGIQLPKGYRDFVTQIANGYFGPPSYGLVTFDGLASDPESFKYVAKPFPFTKAWVWENGEVTDEGTESQIYHGNICIGDDGCGMGWYLIVTGADAGIPWMLCGEGIGHVVPKRDFLQWFEDWLDGRDSFYGLDDAGA